jgi:heme exporter protein A
MYGLHGLDDRLSQVLVLVGLERVANELVRAFSRGMQQRLAIARAILHRPQLLLLDEPHTGLDQEAAAMLDSLLSEVAVEGRTVVMTSHDIARAHRLASRVDILSRGQVAASLPVATTSLAQVTDTYQQVTRV